MLTLLLLWLTPLLALVAGFLWLALRPHRPGMRTGLETQWDDPTPAPVNIDDILRGYGADL